MAIGVHGPGNDLEDHFFLDQLARPEPSISRPYGKSRVDVRRVKIWMIFTNPMGALTIRPLEDVLRLLDALGPQWNLCPDATVTIKYGGENWLALDLFRGIFCAVPCLARRATYQKTHRKKRTAPRFNLGPKKGGVET
ncbi:MAG: hypothetical protein COB16_14820 [Rhodobacteraceae bacterium]|nr:MAG: hypothetical protein COB16_14820 [Paracoccaceae bacterium]